jgi:hypothetical protein
MRGQIAAALCSAALCSAVFGFTASTTLAIAPQKPAKACLEEWRPNKAANEDRGVAATADVAQCRAGGVPVQAAASPSAPVILAAASSNAARDRPTYTTIRDIMDSIIDPSADGVWNAVETVADKEGIHELFPKTDDEWHDVRRAAVRLIEGSNLLMMPGREGAPAGSKSEAPGVELEPAQITALINKNRKGFNAFARALQVIAVEAMHASEAKNKDMLLDIGARMDGVCESCHQTFWYPGQ